MSWRRRRARSESAPRHTLRLVAGAAPVLLVSQAASGRCAARQRQPPVAPQRQMNG